VALTYFCQMKSTIFTILGSIVGINLIGAVVDPVDDIQAIFELLMQAAIAIAGLFRLIKDKRKPGQTFDFANGSADQKLYVQASPPVSAGINNISNRISHIATIDQTTAGTEDIWSEYVAVYGAPAAGTKIFIKVQSVREDTGQVSAQTILSAVVGA
jgi:hypothetical protein